MKAIPSLTAIRGVAALCVVVHHLTEFYRWHHLNHVSSVLYMGYTGVDLFFVLSGFILTRVHMDMAMNPASLGQFGLRRVLRIYPLHLVLLAVIAVMGSFAFVIPRAALDWHTLPYVAALVQPYFDMSTGLWNAVSWSAAVELSCYVVFPLWLAMFRRAPTWLLAPLVLLAAWAAWVVQTHYTQFWTGWGAVWRGWSGFALGSAVGLLSSRRALSRRWVIWLESLACAVLAWGALAKFPQLIPLGSAALICALQWRGGTVDALLSLKPLVYLGEISFSVYLLQILVIDTENTFWPVAHLPAVTPMFLLREALMFASLIGLASLTYRYVERPCLKAFRRRPAPQGNAAQGAAGTAASSFKTSPAR